MKYLIVPIDGFKNLSMVERVLLSQLVYIKKKFKELYPSNLYLSRALGVSISTISRTLKKLDLLNYITLSQKGPYRFILLSKSVLVNYRVSSEGISLKNEPRTKNKALTKFWEELDCVYNGGLKNNELYVVDSTN